jgi:transcriptional regulator with XRE-family HTH domain
MPHHLPTQLRTLRLQRNLSQTELAQLLGVSMSAISHYENLSRPPSIELMLGAEVVFGVPPRAAFSSMYEDIEAQVMARAIDLYNRLEGRTDLSSTEKLRLLSEMIERSEPQHRHL